MLNPVSGSSPILANQVIQSNTRQPQQTPAAQPADTVTLKGTGDADHDGDSK